MTTVDLDAETVAALEAEFGDVASGVEACAQLWAELENPEEMLEVDGDA